MKFLERPGHHILILVRVCPTDDKFSEISSFLTLSLNNRDFSLIFVMSSLNSMFQCFIVPVRETKIIWKNP